MCAGIDTNNDQSCTEIESALLLSGEGLKLSELTARSRRHPPTDIMGNIWTDDLTMLLLYPENHERAVKSGVSIVYVQLKFGEYKPFT